MTLTAPDTMAPTRAHFADPEAKVMALDTPVSCPVLPNLRFRAIASTPAGEHHLVISLDRPAGAPSVGFNLGPDRATIARRGLILLAGLIAHGDLRDDADGMVEGLTILDWLAVCWIILHEELGKAMP